MNAQCVWRSMIADTCMIATFAVFVATIALQLIQLLVKDGVAARNVIRSTVKHVASHAFSAIIVIKISL